MNTNKNSDKCMRLKKVNIILISFVLSFEN